MLKEILQITSESKLIDDIILVSKDDSAFAIGKKFRCIEIIDEKESGVNNAVSLANKFVVISRKKTVKNFLIINFLR